MLPEPVVELEQRVRGAVRRRARRGDEEEDALAQEVVLVPRLVLPQQDREEVLRQVRLGELAGPVPGHQIPRRRRGAPRTDGRTPSWPRSRCGRRRPRRPPTPPTRPRRGRRPGPSAAGPRRGCRPRRGPRAALTRRRALCVTRSRSISPSREATASSSDSCTAGAHQVELVLHQRPAGEHDDLGAPALACSGPRAPGASCRRWAGSGRRAATRRSRGEAGSPAPPHGSGSKSPAPGSWTPGRRCRTAHANPRSHTACAAGSRTTRSTDFISRTAGTMSRPRSSR